MGVKDLLFWGIVLGGGVALGANLMPPREVKPRTSYDASAYNDADFRSAVQRIDNSFRQTWTSENVRPALPADDLTIARRLALGLMGTTPSLEEIRQFEKLPAHERLPWWIDHILQDRRSSDFLAERLARAYVGTEDGPFIFFRRRKFISWLSEQVHQNRPYDHIVKDLVATEGIWTDKPATNFVSVTAQPEKGNQPDPVRLAGRATRAFLGLRLDCAQCHNHPFADWKQGDFEGFSAFFGQTHVNFRGITDGDGEYEVEDPKTQKKKVVAPKVAFAPELLPPEGSGGTLRERLATWITHKKNPYFARAAVNRIWAILCGQPLATPIDNLQTDTYIPPALQILADDFAAHDYDVRRLIRLIASTQVFRMDSKAEHDVGENAEKTWGIFPMTRLRPEQMAGSVLQAASVATIDAESHLVVRILRYTQQSDFIKRYGDNGDDEFDSRGGTIPQRLVMMNGDMVGKQINDSPMNSTTRISWLAGSDANVVEAAYLSVLSRRPSAEESAHFEQTLKNTELSRAQRVGDIYWALINSTEFSWNH